MSIIGKILDIFGPGGNNSFYARDFRNAYALRPDVNPPRQKFQGYVSFVVNRELYGDTFYGDMSNSKFRLRLGSLVRTATLPEVEFKTETKNAYNKKRIVNTGIEYQPVDIKVFDTINNEWLIMFMKYFTYHYMNPRNKQFGGEREVGIDPREAKTSQQFVGSEFGIYGAEDSRWNSNSYGYNVNELANFFERIDYVLYHGTKGVQYSLINPVLTRFKTGEIDYSSSEVMEFDMTFEYESFTISQEVNFGLSEFDIARFENAREFTGPAFVPFNKPELLKERKLEILTGLVNAESYPRSAQPQPSTIDPTAATAAESNQSDTSTDAGAPSSPPPIDSELAGLQNDADNVRTSSDIAATPSEGDIVVTAQPPTAPPPAGDSPLPSIYGPRAVFATPTGKEKSFIGGLLGDIADNALSAAIHGRSIKNAVINTAVGGVVQGIVGVAVPAIRGDKKQPTSENETSTASTAERPLVTPGGGG
jgi:hypothetical protein